MSNQTSSNQPAIEAAVKAFVRALYCESAEAVHRLLIDKQALLLTDAAVDFLDQHIMLAEYSCDPWDFDFTMLQLQLTPDDHTPVPSVAVLLRTPLELLRAARVQGVEVAWRQFAKRYDSDSPQPSEAAIEQAIAAVVNASGAQARSVFEKYQQILLSDATMTYIKGAMAKAKQAGNLSLAQMLGGLFNMLVELRRYGFEEGWRRIMSDDSGVRAQAVMELVFARSLDEKRRVLEENQHILVDDRAIFVLQQIIQADQGSGQMTEARILIRHLRLLEDAKALGIGPAWERFIRS